MFLSADDARTSVRPTASGSAQTFFKSVWTSVDTGGDVMLACYANGVFPSHTREATLTGFEPVLPP